METEHDQLHVSCLSSSKLDKQLRRQVKRVTSAVVILMQVVSPAITKKKFSNARVTTAQALPDSNSVDMESTPPVERIVQCVINHQDTRMLSPVSESSPDLGFGADYSTKGTCRCCCPADYTGLPPTMELLPAEQLAAEISGGKKIRAKNRVKSMSMSVICNKPSVEDGHTDPLMYLDEDTAKEGAGKDRKGARRNPLRQIGNLLGCFMGIRHENGEKITRDNKRSQALALLELSQKQQDALAMKQDTIELLEWKLEQLQLLNSSASAAIPPSPKYSDSSLRSHNPLAPIADVPEMHSIPSVVLPRGFSKNHTDDELTGKCRHHRLFNPKIHDPYLELELGNAELETAILHLFDMTAVKARLAVRYFCKVFMKQMEVSGYSVWRTLAEIEPNTKFLKKDHTAFTLESRLNKALFHSFENDSFDEAGITRIIDPEKRCMIRFRDFQRLKLIEAANAVNTQHEDFDHEFWNFSENKMREMWFLFPWNVVFKDSNERSTFTAAFLDAAKCVWLLHRLAFSVHPHVTILRVGKGMQANSQYVEQVTPIEEQCRKCEGPKIEFMTMPGFQTRKKIIKCQVYRHLQCM